MLNALESHGIPLVGVDPSMTLTYRQEYVQVVEVTPQVNLIQEWLATQSERIKERAVNVRSGEYKLLSHCTEKTSAAPSLRQWQSIFTDLGQTLSVQPVGCCGMSGTYGHEADNLATSQTIYNLSWSDVVNDPDNKGKLVATGYSCRSQVKRMDKQVIPHPAQVLLDLLRIAR